MQKKSSVQKGFEFPEGFLWGSSTAAYQVEGGILNCDWALAADRGILPRAGLACDHYRKYEEDFDIAKNLSQNAHRFSIEWARIEPEEGKFDEEQIEHYRKVLQALHARGITPFVNLWHFTLPTWFFAKKGFQNKKAPELFARYCAYVVEKLGTEAKFWITMNEPLIWLSGGYVKGKWPPFSRNLFKALKVFRQLVKSHRLAYEKMKALQPEIQIGIAKHNMHFASGGGFWNDLRTKYSIKYWNHKFLKDIDDCQDFIGVNYYLHVPYGIKENLPKTDMGWSIYPRGLYEVLVEFLPYNKPVYITENGIADSEDQNRADFIHGHISAVRDAIRKGVDVRGYFYWSLLDNFEWSFGFAKRFGLVEVNYDTFERKVRASAKTYAKICKSNSINL